MRTPIYFRRGNKANLPVLNAGEPGFSVDTIELFIGHSSGNQRVPIVPPTLATWIAPTLLNAWVNYGSGENPIGYYKDDFGIVHVRGLIKSGTVTYGTNLFTFPVGYRPANASIIPTACNNGTTIAACMVELLSPGLLNVGTGVANTYLCLEFSFRAEQ